MNEAATVTAIEALRLDINKRLDDLINQIRNPKNLTYYKPTEAEARDPRNKNGVNLTDRGIEVLFRVFDDGGGYNRASRILGITQQAAKHRKAQWVREGGLLRTKRPLDEDRED